MFGLLDEHPDVQDKQGAASLTLQDAQIEFKDVHFAYKDRAILKGVSFYCTCGQESCDCWAKRRWKIDHIAAVISFL
jgi:ABC-type transport system involved in Fe-S cluster assembly fused permease/ATPase subunit